MNRKVIDIFLMHEVRSGQLEERKGAWQALKDAKAQGLVRAIGLSTHHVDITEAAASMEDLDVVFPLINYAGLGIRKGDAFATKEEMMEMANELSEFTKRHVILKGYQNENNEMGMVVLDKKDSSLDIVYNDKVDYMSHGTGDVFASSFVGSTMSGKSPTSAAKIAGELTKKSIEKTIDDPSHNYGVKFEQVIPYIYELLKSI